MAEGKQPGCLDCGDWIVVGFIVAFAATGAVFCYKHPDPINFGAWTGTLGIILGAFHWIRVRDQKVPDA